jgi:DEAD/DEAH box helicase domain-containing protein
MRLSIGVTYSTALDKYIIYREEEVMDLINQLRRADLVVGYNHINFDYGVLQGYDMWSMADTTRNLDLCKYLEEQSGIRLKLDSVAKASLKHTKTAEGTQALEWWAEYESTGNPEPLLSIARYCCYDVKVTRDVHRFGVENGYVLYDSRTNGEFEKIPVDWKI